MKGMANSLDKRVFVGVSRGVWDCIGRAIADSLCSLEDGDAAQVLLSTPAMPCLVLQVACADLLLFAMLALSTAACTITDQHLYLRAAAEHWSNVLSGLLLFVSGPKHIRSSLARPPQGRVTAPRHQYLLRQLVVST